MQKVMEELTPEILQNLMGFSAHKPVISEYILASDEFGGPSVCAVRWLIKNKGYKWMIMDRNRIAFMNVENGLFEPNPIGKQWVDNSFDTWQDANDCFRKFYE